MTHSTDPRSVVNVLRDAINSKDHEALSELFSEDAEFVSINGARLRGRDAIAVGHAQVFSQTLADSKVSLTSVDTKFLNEDIVVCHAEWSRADATPETIPMGTGIFTLVLHRVSDDWKIVAATNVQNARPPVSS